MAITAPNLDILGERQSGQDVRTQNVMACAEVANLVKPAFGPEGDRLVRIMAVDSVGDVTVTNDGATILKLLDVEHPAAKVIVELADLQDREVGDGTTSVIIRITSADPESILMNMFVECHECTRLMNIIVQ